MAQTAAQKKAAELAKNKKLLAETQALLATTKAQLKAAQEFQKTLPARQAAADADLSEARATQIQALKDLEFSKAEAARIAKEQGRRYDPVTGKIGEPLNVKTKAEYDAEQAALAEKARLANEKKDAFAAIETTIKKYGFNETEMKEINAYLAGTLINPKIGPNQALLDMRELDAYKARFAGNELRFKNGFNRLSESDYLDQEDAYGQKLNEYGVGSLGTRAQFATLIANRVSVNEVGQRAALAVDRVKNADPNIMATLKRFYTGITDADLVAYFLNPAQQLPEIERKVVTGEIGAAAKQYGLNDISLARAQEFAALGVDQATARRDYELIADKLPRGSQLASISPEDKIVYDQSFAEDATIKGLASAKRAEENLKAKEIARFLGSSGAAQGAFSTSYLKKSSAAGQI